MSRWDMVCLLREHSSNLQGSQKADKNQIFARGIRFTAKTQKKVYHEKVDELFRTQMIYLIGDKKLHDDSDYEDPCAALNIRNNNF